jgi:hypothetical protein
MATADRVMAPAPEPAWEAESTFSNRGDRLALLRGTHNGDVEMYAAAVDLTTGTEVVSRVPVFRNGACCTAVEWSPDDTSVLITQVDATGVPTGQVLFDPETGTVEALAGGRPGWSSWQRLPPNEAS